MRLTETDFIIPAWNSLPTILFITVSVHMSETFSGRGFWRCLRYQNWEHPLNFIVTPILFLIYNSTKILYSTLVVRNVWHVCWTAAGRVSEWEVKARDSSSWSSKPGGKADLLLRKRDTGSIWGFGVVLSQSFCWVLPAHLVCCSGKKNVVWPTALKIWQPLSGG